MSKEQEMILRRLEKSLKTKINIPKKREIDPYKPVPEFCSRYLKQFGRNPYGEPIYRVIWGQGPECEIITGGYWFDNGKTEYRKVKSPCEKKYILQKWLPAEMFGSPECFYSELSNNIDHNFWSDPIYPSRGRYEHVYTFNDAQKQMVYPSIVEMNLICAALRATKLYTRQERINAELEKEKRKQKEKEDKVESIINGEMLKHTGTPYFLKKCAEFEAKKKLSAAQVQKQFNLPDKGFKQISEGKINGHDRLG